MGSENHRVAGGNHADSVVDHSTRRVGGRCHRGDDAPGGVLGQGQTAVAGKHGRPQTFDPRRLPGLGDVLENLVFDPSHSSFGNGHFRQRPGVGFADSTNGFNHLGACSQATQALLSLTRRRYSIIEAGEDTGSGFGNGHTGTTSRRLVHRLQYGQNDTFHFLGIKIHTDLPFAEPAWPCIYMT